MSAEGLDSSPSGTKKFRKEEIKLGEILDELVANMLFEKTLRFSPAVTKIHERNPSQKLASFYFNIRNKENPKPGILDERDYNLIARCIIQSIDYNKFEFNAIAGIPRAGDPIANAIFKIMREEPDYFQQGGGARAVKLSKEEKNGKRRVIPMPGFEYRKGERVLLLDDLISHGDSKLEAIESVESQGVKVSIIVVLIDIGLGGTEYLKKGGYNLHAVFTGKSLFDYYLLNKKINSEQYKIAMDYINKK